MQGRTKTAKALKLNSILECANSNILKTFTDVMGVNYNIIALDGSFIEVNEQMREKIPKDKKAYEIDPAAWLDCVEVMKSGVNKMVEEQYGDLWYLSVKQPIIENGKSVAILVISIDVTEKKQAELAKRKFLSNIHHDIKTPLSGIAMLTKILKDKEKDSSNIEMLDLILQSSKNLAQYLQQITEAAAITLHADDTVLFDFNVKEAINNIMVMVQPTLKAKGLNFNLTCPNEEVTGDELKFKQIAFNLISNAIKYTQKGFVEVKVKINNKHLSLTVYDTGIGIAKEHQKMIFEKFSRVVPSNLEPIFNGNGLGLYIVKKAIQKLKGTIRVKSEPNKGSIFNVLVPIQRDFSQETA